ncbi:ADP-ribosylation factor-binding protein GGA3-like [Phalaenopsis equestris]|uniref:ADP-ribosylation factor-binding protein GGA3-like n=1 Tax=Phalaenopsis equestris TaxID=78828 RepID=UPI0009E5F33C|nr:ADP-ribosylation factor-binding protein GGA3-like [Phalaenopsis equestris]
MMPYLASTSLSATVRVEKATSHLLMIPDWTMNMDICDAINTDPLQAKEFVKAVKKRLQHKNPRVQFLALMLLETMIKNCGDFVHFQVVDREILSEMVKIVRKTADIQVRDKILVLLESWQEAFGGAGGKYPQYYYAYAELKTSGIRFPERQKDAALIYTPTGQTFHPQVGYGMPSNSVERLNEAIENGNLSLSDLKNIRSVTELFIDMLRAVNPEDRTAVDDEVITDLASQCRVNQKKLMQLINSTENEELLGEALALFENLQTALARHDAIASGSPLPPNIAQSISIPSLPPPSVPAIQHFDDKDEEEDDSSSLARRDSKLKSAGDQLAVSPNHSDITTPTSTSGVSEASSSIATNALVPFDPPAHDTALKKEDDMIDLLSLVLSTDLPPQTPSSPLPQSNQNQNPFSTSPNPQQYPNNPQPITSNGNYATNNGYVAPWAQSAGSQTPALVPPAFPQQQMMPYPYNYQAPSWPPPGITSNPFLSTAPVQYPAMATPSSVPATPFQHPASQSSMAPPTSSQFPASQTSMALVPAAPVPVLDSDAIQRLNNSIGSRQYYANPNNSKQAGSSSAPKPYISPDKLFEGIIELRNPDGSLKSRNASTLWGTSGGDGAGINGGRK